MMKKVPAMIFIVGMIYCNLMAEDPAVSIDVSGLRQTIAVDKSKTVPVEVPRTSAPTKTESSQTTESNNHGNKSDFELRLEEKRRQTEQIKMLKEKESHIPRFAQDLFVFRDDLPDITEGGISDDYVLGIGDQLQVTGFESATFEVSGKVDGRGQMVIPKVGSIKVGGLSLGKARVAIQKKVSENSAGTVVDVSVFKLREIRVFVLGEVYRPGSYLVPSLSSLVNVLSMSGGPTMKGTYRDVRIVRGGNIVKKFDLYPIRMDGNENLNFYFQNGDTVFVPLALNTVVLEGPYLRVGNDEAIPKAPIAALIAAEKNVSDKLPEMEFELTPDETAEDALRFAGGLLPVASRDSLSLRRKDDQGLTSVQDLPLEMLGKTKMLRGDVLSAFLKRDRITNVVYLNGWIRVPGAFARPEGLHVADLLKRDRQILPDTYLERGDVVRTMADGTTRFIHFNLRQALEGDLTNNVLLEDRDSISIFKRQFVDPPPTVTFEDPGGKQISAPLHEGMRVSDLIHQSGIPKLKDGKLVLPNLYLRRGELVRRNVDGTTKLLTFDTERAFKEDPSQNLLLENQDVVKLYSAERMRLEEKVTLNGPFTKAGVFPLHQDMRVSDLIFEAGIPQKQANQLVAELARTRDGQPNEIFKLDLGPLTSTEGESPLVFPDDIKNPLLKDDDVITVFEKPDFLIHRTVRIRGQVAKPGLYVLDSERETMSQLIARAGGLTSEAMPKAGVFFRSLNSDPRNSLSSLMNDDSSISGILDRLNETKIYDFKGTATTTTVSAGASAVPTLFKFPVLHGIGTGKLNRVVVNISEALAGNKDADIELKDNDEIIIPRITDTVMILGETATPFAYYKIKTGMKVHDLISIAGGTTRNADLSNIRLLKADGRIVDTWVSHRALEPGDSVLVPQVIHRDTNWEETLTSLTPIAILINAFK